MNECKKIINSSKYWFLRQLSLVNGQLVLIISEGKVSDQKTKITVSEGVEIGPVKKITPNSTSLHFRIEFDSPISFQRVDESYPWARGYQSKIHGTIGKVEPLPPHVIDRTLHYYQVDCLDDLVDVVTTNDPKITAISESDFDCNFSQCENYLRIYD